MRMHAHTHNTWPSDESLTPEVSVQSDDHKHQRNFNDFQALARRLTLDLFDLILVLLHSSVDIWGVEGGYD